MAIAHRSDRAGNTLLTIFVDDFDVRLAQIADRGIEPLVRETYANGVRHSTYHDPDGNEISIGGAPQ